MPPTPQTAPTPASTLLASFGQPWDWPGKALGTFATWYAGLLSFTARGLQAQANLLQDMATSNDPLEMMKRQCEFVQASWDSYTKEFSKVLDLAKEAGTPGKGAS